MKKKQAKKKTRASTVEKKGAKKVSKRGGQKKSKKVSSQQKKLVKKKASRKKAVSVAEKARKMEEKKIEKEKELSLSLWENLKNEIDTENFLNYSMKQTFSEKTALKHPRFGMGFVVSVASYKIEVVFKEGAKLLVHNYSD